MQFFSEEEKAHIDDLLVVALESGDTGIMDIIVVRILEKRNLINWKVFSYVASSVQSFNIISLYYQPHHASDKDFEPASLLVSSSASFGK